MPVAFKPSCHPRCPFFTAPCSPEAIPRAERGLASCTPPLHRGPFERGHRARAHAPLLASSSSGSLNARISDPVRSRHDARRGGAEARGDAMSKEAAAARRKEARRCPLRPRTLRRPRLRKKERATVVAGQAAPRGPTELEPFYLLPEADSFGPMLAILPLLYESHKLA